MAMLERIRARRWWLTAAARAELRRDRAGLPPDDPDRRARPMRRHWSGSAVRRITPPPPTAASRATTACRRVGGPVSRDDGIHRADVADLFERNRKHRSTRARPADARLADEHSVRLGRVSRRHGGVAPSRPGHLQHRADPARTRSRAAAFGAPYDDAMRRAADWLVATQDADGCWRRYPTPFAEPGEKAVRDACRLGAAGSSPRDASRADTRTRRWQISAGRSRIKRRTAGSGTAVSPMSSDHSPTRLATRCAASSRATGIRRIRASSRLPGGRRMAYSPLCGRTAICLAVYVPTGRRPWTGRA